MASTLVNPPEVKDLIISDLNPPLRVTHVKDEDGLHALHSFLATTDELGWDYETNITKRFVDRKIRTCQFGNRDQQFVVDLLKFAGSTEALMEQGWRKPPKWAGPVLEVIRPVLESDKWLKVGANLSFEYMTSLWCLGLRPWHFWDVQIVEKVLNAGKVGFFQHGFWALDDIVERYLRLRINKELQKSFDLESDLTEAQLGYAALDTRLPLAVRKGQLIAADKLQVGRAAQIENDAIPAFTDMHVNGFRMVAGSWTELVASIQEQHLSNTKGLDNFFVSICGHRDKAPDVDLASIEKLWRDEKDKELRKRFRQEFIQARRTLAAYTKAKDTWQGEAAINYGAHDQLLTALQKSGFKTLKGTGKKALAKFSDKPIIQAIQAYRKSEKSLSTYGLKWLEYIDPDTGLIHANHQQMGAETGRPSCTAPNLYNLPKDKRFRKTFQAPEGYVCITTDMSGAELRILAELSGEESWIEAFNRNLDMHSKIARMMQADKWDAAKGVNCRFAHDEQKCECPDHKTMRDGAKAVNFGVAYGKEAFALAEDLKISVKLAEELLAIWRKANAKVQKWLVDAGNFAKMHKFCRTLSGRIRFFKEPTWDKAKELAMEDAEKYKRACLPKDISKKYGSMFGSIEREGKNTPIQGSNADIAKTGMGCGFDKDGKPFMWHLLPEYNWTNPDGTVKEAKLVNHVYDEYVVFCPVETAESCQLMIGDCIKRAGAEFMKSVVMDYEGHIAQEWTK